MVNTKKFNSILLAIIITVASGCAGMKSRDAVSGSAGIGLGASQGSGPFDETKPSDSTVETPAPADEKKVAVVLGPGGYKAFAHTGVLKALGKNNIPIHAIVGIEWGSLVAGLYAQRGQVHEAEWKLYKLEQTELKSGGFFGRREGPIALEKLNDYFDQNLGKLDLRELTTPFYCPSVDLRTGVQSFKTSGPLKDAVKACVGARPVLEPTYPTVAGLFSGTDIIEDLKRAGYNVVILVNVLGDGSMFGQKSDEQGDAIPLLWYEARRALWRAKQSATDVIDVPTRGLSITDFESRKVLSAAGERAGQREAPKIAAKYGF